MGKYRVTTDAGTFEVTTDEPEVPGMEKLGGTPPAAAKPPIPNELKPDSQQEQSFWTSPHGLIRSGLRRAVHGVEAAAEPGANAKMGGASEVLRGLGTAALPAAIPLAVANPLAAAGGLAAGTAGGKAGGFIAHKLGASPEAQDLTEDISGLVAGGAGAKAGSVAPRLWRADPRVAINRALRPVPSDPGFPERIPQTLSAIKQANPGFKPAVEDGHLNLGEAADRAIASHQKALDPWLTRAAGVRISGEPIVRATEKATQGMLPSEGASAQNLIDRARNDYQNFTPTELRTRLHLLNERLSSFYNQSPARQSAALSDIPEAVLKAQRDAVADTLYRALDPEGAGAGPRLIQSRTGDLIDIRDAAMRRNNSIVAEQPLTPIGRVVDPLKGLFRSVLPGKATGAGIAFAEGSEGRSLPLIRRAFKAVGNGDQPNVLPRPETPFYPSGNPSRLLGAGDIATPPPADNSFVRGMPVDASQWANIQRRALPAGTAPFTQGTVVPDIMGRPRALRQIEGPAQPGIPTGQGVHEVPPTDTSGLTVTNAKRGLARNPKTGRMFRYYTSDGQQK